MLLFKHFRRPLLGNLLLFVQIISGYSGQGTEQHKRQSRRARKHSQRNSHKRTHTQSLRIIGNLLKQHLVGGVGHTGFRNQNTGSNGDNQRRNLRHQPVADSQTGISFAGIGKTHIVLHHTDNDTGNNIDECDNQTGNRVTADEFGRTVHGSVKRAFFGEFFAAGARLIFGNQPRRQIGVDGHLLTGHGVQGKAGGDFGDTAGTFGNNHKVDDNQNGKNNNADNKVVAHDETAESGNNLAGGIRPLVAFGKNQTGGSQVQRQPIHGGNQQNQRESIKLVRPLDKNRRHQNQTGDCNRKSQGNIQQPGRHRHNQDNQHQDNGQSKKDVAAFGRGNQ